MDEHDISKERDELKPIIDWLAGYEQQPAKPDTDKRNVIHIDTMRLYLSKDNNYSTKSN